jgi:hypothetical protein
VEVQKNEGCQLMHNRREIRLLSEARLAVHRFQSRLMRVEFSFVMWSAVFVDERLADLLTDAELREQFLVRPRTVKELVAVLREKMKHAGNKERLGQFLKQHCRVTGTDQDGAKMFALR